MSHMPEQQPSAILIGEGRPEALLRVGSYGGYVEALTRTLQFKGNPDALYGADRFDPTWFDALQLGKDTKPIIATFRVGEKSSFGHPKTTELHSDGKLPESLDELKNTKYGDRRLAAYALAEAKLAYFQKNFGDIKSARGAQTFSLWSEAHDIHAQAEQYLKDGYWKADYVPVGKKIRAGVAAGALAWVAWACGTPVGAVPNTTEVPPVPIAVATEQVPSAKTPVPDKEHVNSAEAQVSRITDAAEVAKEVDGFTKAQVNWYDQDGNVVTKPGDQSGLSLLGLMDVKAGSNTLRFGLVTSNGGVEHLVEKMPDGSWVLLIANDSQIIDPSSGNTFNALGLYKELGTGKYPGAEHAPAGSLFLPVISQEYDQSGSFVKGWVYDAATDTFYTLPGVGGGQGKLLALVERGDTALVAGRAQMATEGVTDWNFKYLADGRLGIVDASGKTLDTWSGTEWVKPVEIYTIDEAIQIILRDGSMKPEDRIYSASFMADNLMPELVRDPDGGWMFSWQGVTEKRMGALPDSRGTTWFNNRLWINDQWVDCTDIAVATGVSGHSYIGFRDRNGNVVVIKTDTIFMPAKLDNRPLLP